MPNPINTSVVWANSSAADTEKLVTPAGFGVITSDDRFELLIENPSAVTALTVAIQNTWTDSDSTAQVSEHQDTKTVAVSSKNSFTVRGTAFIPGGQVSLKNDTILGVGDGFTAHVQLRKVGNS
jgi:hypothetical protein